MIELRDLPFDLESLQPYVSAETLQYHHGKHHRTYVNNLNGFIKDDPALQGLSLEQIVKTSSGGVFNNAAQVWNHDFYWDCLSPKGGSDPTGELAQKIIKDFGSIEAFRAQFTEVALKTFGSGWAWLVLTPEDRLEIMSTSNALTPLTSNNRVLMTCDVWEHAYYIDYRNARPTYLDAFWNLVNWDFVAQRLKNA